MTREEAALILDPETSRDALLPYESTEERIAVCEDACRLGAAALREQEERRWIPVTERFPKLIPCSAGTAYSEAVNVLTSGRKVITAVWDGTDFIADAEFWEAEDEEITHWTPVLLPLPEPPKEDAKKKGNCGERGRRWACDIGPGKCDEWPDPAPMTNADRIRAASDDELAQILCEVELVCDVCEVCGTEIACDPAYCRRETIEWLQQPAEGE